MQSGTPAKKVTILLYNSPHSGTHLKVLERLREHGVVNAFAFRATAAIDARGELQTNRLAEFVPDLPTIIVWIDKAETVAHVLPQIRPLVVEGLVTVDDTTLDFASIARPRDLPKSITVADVMTADVVTVEPATSIAELVAKLLDRGFRALPVVDAERKVVGIVTNGDLVRRGGLPVRLELLKTFDTPELHDQLASMTQAHREAGEIMTPEVVTVSQSLDVRRAADLMIRRRLKRLPVVDESGRLVGIVSRVDLLRSVMPAAGGALDAARVRGPFTGETALAEVMSRTPPTIAAEATISEVLSVVTATRLNLAVVVDSDRTVLGVISDADVVRRLDPDLRPGVIASLMHRVAFANRKEGSENAYQHATARTAGALMHTDIVIANQAEKVRDVLRTMLDQEKKVIPVVDDNRRLVGIVDRADLLRSLREL